MRIVVVSDRACMRRALLDRLRDEPLIAVAGQATTADEAVATARLCQAGAVLIDAELSHETAVSVFARLAERGYCGHAFIIESEGGQRPTRITTDEDAPGPIRHYCADRELEQLVAHLRMIALDLRLPGGLAHAPLASRAA